MIDQRLPLMRWIFFWFCLLSTVAGAAPDAPLTIHFISGSKEYESEASLREFVPYLEATHGFRCTVSWGRDGASRIENLDALARADLLVVFARRLKLSEEQMALIRAHWEAGKPVIGIRTASHAWGGKDNPDNAYFDQVVLGNHYTGHYRDEPVDVRRVEAQREHPILRGVGAFTSRKLYRSKALAPAAVALQIGSNGKGEEVVTLVHEHKGGRVFYTSLGVPEDFRNDNFRRLLVNAIRWTARRATDERAP